VLRIGLTGGIASGKSTAAARFAELGALVVDHDILARKVVEPGSAALADLAREFGDRVVPGGVLDRAGLANIVFQDPVSRQRLNDIIHPYVKAAAIAADKRARASGEAVVVHDIPLLVETGQGGNFDLVVTVETPLLTRLTRLREGRGLSHEEALGRIEAQASDEERAAVADAVLDGSGSVAQLHASVDAFWAEHVPHEVVSPAG
jgi:dephospho-CoA kinase